MKTYKCDACGMVIDNPHKEKMKEFYIACGIGDHGIYPEKAKRKQKIHLCDDCFHGLYHIAEKRADHESTVTDEPQG